MSQKQVAENILYDLIEDICDIVNINISEWYLDKQLFEVIVHSSDKTDVNFIKACYAYDCCYGLSKALNLDIDPKYCWFTNLTKTTN